MANPNFVGVLSGLAAAGIVSAAMLWTENVFSEPSALTQSNSESKAPSDQSVNGNPIGAQSATISKPVTLVWANILEQEPNPQVVTDTDLRKRIQETGLPWRVQDKVSGIEMLLVPQGKFEMGMISGDTDALANEKPDHSVTISKPFYLGRTEVTQGQWFKVMKENPSNFKVQNPRAAMIDVLMKQGITKEDALSMTASASIKIDALPVEKVSWEDCQLFCAMAGLHLPTEAQWEYACRAGVSAPRYGEVNDIAWHEGNANGETKQVAQKLPNALGFYDMIGNLWEWTSDMYVPGFYATCKDGVIDPCAVAVKSTPEALRYVVRGSSWGRNASTCRATVRAGIVGTEQNRFFGFRVARDPSQPESRKNN
jgi:formylglycine-generating enzyme required for sulfatase activity